MKNLIIISLLILSGCAGYMSLNITEDTEHGQKKTHLRLRSTRNPLDGSYITSTTNGVEAHLSASQDVSALEREKQMGRTGRLPYYFCGILLLIGGACIFFVRTNTKLGLTIIASALAGFAVLSFVEASKQIMGIVLPVLTVAGAGYILFAHLPNRTDK